MTTIEFFQQMHQLQHKMLSLEQLLDISDLTEEEKNTVIDPKVADLITKFDAATNSLALSLLQQWLSLKPLSKLRLTN